MNKLLEFLNSEINLKDVKSSDGHSELFGSVFFIFISAVLTVLNIVKHAGTAMTVATSLLIVGFSIAAALAHAKKIPAAKLVILVLCGAIFTLFAVIGGNDGFAILWILLVPIIGALWIGLKAGIILSTYFLVFLIVLFYTPVSECVKDYYTPTFMLRFPVLYLASFGANIFLMWQREVLINKLNYESSYDALTGLHNRRYYNDMVEKLNKDGIGSEFSCFSFDLNGLKYVNDHYGHNAGDELIKAAADIIAKNFKDAECFRTGGDEFIAFSKSIDAQKAISGMNADTSSWKGEFSPSISISVGYACAGQEPGTGINELSILADERMYESKAKYYEQNSVAGR